MVATKDTLKTKRHKDKNKGWKKHLGKYKAKRKLVHQS